MDIKSEVKKLAQYIEPQTVLDQLQQPLQLIREEPQFLVPSFGLGGDGISLTSVFVVSTKYMFELRITPKDKTEFDIIVKKSVFNYRVNTGTQEISKDDKVVASYQTATVEFVHMPNFDFRSFISYVGSEQRQWLQLVYEAFPLESLLRQLTSE